MSPYGSRSSKVGECCRWSVVYEHPVDIFDTLFSASFGRAPHLPLRFGVVGGTARSGKFKLAAIGKYDTVFAATSSSYTAYQNNCVYWYFYSPKSKSMGFASTNMVTA